MDTSNINSAKEIDFSESAINLNIKFNDENKYNFGNFLSISVNQLTSHNKNALVVFHFYRMCTYDDWRGIK